MRRPRSESTSRSLRWGVVIGAAAAAFATTSVALAAFTSTVAGGGSSAYSTKRIFPGVRRTSAWTVRDASGGGAEALKDDALSSADGTTTQSGSVWATTFSATRYLEFDFNSALPDGLSVSSPQLNFRMASTSNAATWCFYVEVYRVSTATLIGTHGSSGSPTCYAGTTQTTTNISLAEVSTTTIANDLRVRVYIDDSKSKQSATDMVTVTGSTPYSSFTAYEQVYRDRSSGGTATATGWGPGSSGDGFNYATAAAWAATFSTTRYVKFTFDPGVPAGAVITAASLDFYYRTSIAADSACWYMETYNGSTLLAAHGSSGSTLSCNSSNVTYSADNVPLPEVNAVTDANSLTVKAYMKDTLLQKTQIDLVRLNLTYYLD